MRLDNIISWAKQMGLRILVNKMMEKDLPDTLTYGQEIRP